ncbi:MAG: beta-mannosidase, partial [Actinomycetota bacterium]
MRTTERHLRDGWTFRQLDAPPIPNSDLVSWQPAQVPGHVHLDLLRLGVIPDPFERMYERAVQWVDDAEWAYRCTFDVSADELDGARHVVHFGGLDTIATVLLNDGIVLTTDNMFVPHEADVTEQLRAGDNTLEVRFESAERVGRERLDAATGIEEARATPFGRGLGARSFVRKAQYMWGWDWGPRLRGCGIWQDVTLVRIPVARIADWSWRSSLDADGSATVTVDVATEAPADIEVRLQGHGVDVTGTDSVRIPEPKRWWSAGLGDQPLYDLTITAIVDGTVVDAISARIGLREVELVREADEAGESFFFRVNGKPIFAKGANWIPDDSFPARTTRERVFEQLRLARECGMNMIRIWGGGLYESDDFYDACDELGLLVWQDFPYACALYPEDDDAARVAVDESTRAIRRVRNHTALALWCGNNENQWLAWMVSGGRETHVLGQRLYDEVLPAVVAAEDPGRAYWPSSPWGSEANPSGDGTGDSHYWNVWHGEGDWKHYTKCTS